MRTDSSEGRERFEATALPLLPAVYAYAIRLSRNAETARDLVPETYLRAYRTFNNFRPGTNCKAWLFTILYSIFVNRYWKRRRELKTVPLEEIEGRFQASLDPNDALRAGSPGPNWTNRDIEAALDELPEDFRATVILVDIEELSYEEAAAALRCPVGTVRSRLSRARKLLYSALEEHARRVGYLRETGSER
ncbi:MAG: sigma-70 family RNA polymerase sigma factor [Thermoanaerobaculia bacterium]